MHVATDTRHIFDAINEANEAAYSAQQLLHDPVPPIGNDPDPPLKPHSITPDDPLFHIINALAVSTHRLCDALSRITEYIDNNQGRP